MNVFHLDYPIKSLRFKYFFVRQKCFLILISSVFLLAKTPLLGQQNLTLYGMKEVAQATYLNPGFEIKHRLMVNNPIGFQNYYVSNNGFQLNQLFVRRANSDSSDLRIDQVLKVMKSRNFMAIDAMTELFGLGFKVGKNNFISLGVIAKNQASFHYPRDIFALVYAGNGSPEFLGKRADLDGLGVELNSYLEYSLGFTRTINSKLTVGTRLKLLNGIANVHTERSELGLTTDATDFDLTLDGSASVKSSNSLSFLDSNPTIDFLDLIGFRNKGFGLDLGASYKLTKKIELSASVLDLGFIRWNTNVKNYELNAFNYTFEGIVINDLLNDSIDIGQELVDTLSSIFATESNNDAYTTPLYTRIYLGGVYSLNKTFSASATVYSAFNQSKYTFGTALAFNIHLRNWFSFSVNYSSIGRSANNVGMGLRLKGGPLQFFLTSDNILVAIHPSGARNAHISFGLSFVSSIKKENDKPKVL